MKLTDKQREEMIERLERDMTNTVYQWALTNYDALYAYVSESQQYHNNSDVELIELCDVVFDEELSDTPAPITYHEQWPCPGCKTLLFVRAACHVCNHP